MYRPYAEEDGEEEAGVGDAVADEMFGWSVRFWFRR